MENVEHSILDEAFSICYKYLNSPVSDFEFKPLNIYTKHGIKYLTDDPKQVNIDTLLYKSIKTLLFLQNRKIIEFSHLSGLKSIELFVKENKPLGIIEVKFNKTKAVEFVKGQLELLNNKKNTHRPKIIIPEGLDHMYVNRELFISLQNDTPASIDFSNSPVTRACFETIYYLYRDSNKKYFSRNEILERYMNRKKVEIEWHEFVNAVGDIRKKIRAKNLTKRVILEYKRKSYRFEILPLSPSD